jgi:hypothetical protein
MDLDSLRKMVLSGLRGVVVGRDPVAIRRALDRKKKKGAFKERK